MKSDVLVRLAARGSAVALCGALTACSGGCSSSAGVVRQGHAQLVDLDDQPEGRDRELREVAIPNIKITAPPNYGSGGTFYAKLTTALAGGRARA